MACDRKSSTWTKAKHSWQVQKIGHFFKCLHDAIDREGECIMHDRRICKVPRRSADMVVIGMSCQPWSVAQNVCAPYDHADYETVMHDIPEYIKSSGVKGGILETVWAMESIMPASEKRRQGTKKETYLHCFLDKLTKCKYAWATLELNNNTWLNSSKNRRQ
jgi:hypothetical protein